jgi:hypothetical protein
VGSVGHAPRGPALVLARRTDEGSTSGALPH